MNSAVLSQAWRSMKTPLGRPGSLMATRTVVTALPAVGVIFISGSTQNRPVMVTVFMVFPLWWVAVGQNVLRGKAGVSREARRAEGEVLVGPVTVSERSERRQKLVRALMPGGPEHHLGSSDPRPGEDHRTSSGPAGRPKVGTRCTPQSTSPTQRCGRGGDPGNGRLSWDMASIPLPQHDGWLDRPDLTRTRWSEGSTPVACPHDGFALAPDAERALAAEEGWLSERGGRCPTPPPRPAVLTTHTS